MSIASRESFSTEIIKAFFNIRHFPGKYKDMCTAQNYTSQKIKLIMCFNVKICTYNNFEIRIIEICICIPT